MARGNKPGVVCAPLRHLQCRITRGRGTAHRVVEIYERILVDPITPILAR